jgi:hypothetical protein
MIIPHWLAERWFLARPRAGIRGHGRQHQQPQSHDCRPQERQRYRKDKTRIVRFSPPPAMRRQCTACPSLTERRFPSTRRLALPLGKTFVARRNSPSTPTCRVCCKSVILPRRQRNSWHWTTAYLVRAFSRFFAVWAARARPSIPPNSPTPPNSNQSSSIPEPAGSSCRVRSPVRRTKERVENPSFLFVTEHMDSAAEVVYHTPGGRVTQMSSVDRVQERCCCV